MFLRACLFILGTVPIIIMPRDWKAILWDNRVLIAIILLGLSLRLLCLTCESLWLDEGYSVLWAGQAPLEMLNAVSNDVHPPLYFLILHYWIALFGDSEYVIRLLSVIFGTASVFMIYRTGLLLTDKRASLAAALIMALSAFHIHYSQEIRGYSLMVMLTLLSMHFFIRYLKERGQWTGLLYVAFSALLLYTHYFGLLFLVSQGIYLIARRALGVEKGFPVAGPLILLASAVMLFLPWMGFLLRQAAVVGTGEFLGWVEAPSLLSVLRTLADYSAYFSQHAGMWAMAPSLALALLFTALFLKPFLSRACIRAWTRCITPESMLLLSWLVIPIAVPFLISYAFVPVYYARFTAPASVALYLLAARGLSGLDSVRLRQLLTASIIILSLAGVSLQALDTSKEQWREAVGHMEENAGEGDLALINSWYCHIPFDYYFNESGPVQRDVFPKWEYTVDEKNINAMEQAVTGRERVWLFLSHGGDPQGLIPGALEDGLGYSIKERESYVGIELYLFERK